MKISEFVKPELDYFREVCNFTEEETQYFNYKAKDMSNVQIALEMHISEAKVSVLARKVKTKIKKVL